MKCKFLLSIVSFIGLSLFVLSATAADTVEKFHYQLTADHGLDLSELLHGSLQVAAFSDRREDLSGKHINNTMQLPVDAAELVRNAVVQGFAQGNAPIVNADAPQIFSGEVTEFNAKQLESGDTQVSITAKLQLQSASGKRYWQGSIIGKATVAASEGINQALQQALDKFVGNLFYEEYLLIQLID